MSDIEEFLKRAAAMRAQQAQRAQRPPPQRVPPAPQPVVYVPEVMDAEVIEPDQVSGDDVASGVQRHLDTSRFQQRASQLASDVRSTDEAIESHLHAAFEHRLGALGATTEVAEDSSLDTEENATKAKSAQPSFDIAALLRSPQNIRNAIILSEVLNPPEDRWK